MDFSTYVYCKTFHFERLKYTKVHFDVFPGWEQLDAIWYFSIRALVSEGSPINLMSDLLDNPTKHSLGGPEIIIAV